MNRPLGSPLPATDTKGITSPGQSSLASTRLSAQVELYEVFAQHNAVGASGLLLYGRRPCTGLT